MTDSPRYPYTVYQRPDVETQKRYISENSIPRRIVEADGKLAPAADQATNREKFVEARKGLVFLFLYMFGCVILGWSR
jgi:hypothetical protein